MRVLLPRKDCVGDFAKTWIILLLKSSILSFSLGTTGFLVLLRLMVVMVLSVCRMC